LGHGTGAFQRGCTADTATFHLPNMEAAAPVPGGLAAAVGKFTPEKLAKYIEHIETALVNTERATATWAADHNKNPVKTGDLIDRARCFLKTSLGVAKYAVDHPGSLEESMRISVGMLAHLPTPDEMRACWKPRKNGAYTKEELAQEYALWLPAYTLLHRIGRTAK
jgi:hypothetical protein